MSLRSVLITGGTGSFGHAFVRALLAPQRTRTLAIGPNVHATLDEAPVERIVIFSRDELKQAKMCAEFTDPRLRFFIGDVRDRARLKQALRGVQFVVHAAAMKRVESCEDEPGEAVATNVIGTQNVAHAAIAAGVESAIFLSTDKAPAAHTLYGATKFCAERLWLRSNVYAAGTVTRLAATRYGNVLGSRGSVVETWREQLARYEPLTLTDARCTRFWMTIDDAVQLVLRARELMRGGEVFVPKIGASTLLDLARALVERNGVYGPGHVEIGLRPGERRHETLISFDEARSTYEDEKHFVIEPENRSWEQLSPLSLPRVADGFDYRSDNAKQLAIDELRGMLE